MFVRPKGPKNPPNVTRRHVEALHLAGLTAAEIAARIGISKGTVAYHMRRFGLVADDRFSRRYDWREIREAYECGLSMSQCAERFGFNKSSWFQAVTRGDIRPRPREMPIELLLVRDRPQTGRSHLKKRLIAEGLKAHRCERCGINEWQGRPLSLQLHHRNGDGRDNRLSNLQILCANCHSQTETWGGRNGHRRGKQALLDDDQAA